MVKKVIIIILCFNMFLCLFITSSKCVDSTRLEDVFDHSSHTDVTKEIEENATNLLGNIIRGMQIFGVGISIIMLTVLGAKYVVSSVEERAQIKKHLVVFVIGAIIFFSASEIIKILQTFILKNTEN